MKGPMKSSRDAALRAQDGRAGQALRDAKARERLDTPLGVLAAAVVLCLMGIGYVTAVSLDRHGVFDPALLRPLPDARIVSNLRDSDAPFLGATTLGDGEGAVVTLRDDGQMARFDESTGLTSHWTVDPTDIGLQSKLVAISAGCGRERATGPDTDATSACSDPDRLYVLSKDGGLAESDTGKNWRVRLRDAPWIGRNGAPVQQTDVTAWASSDDGRYIAVFAGAQGMALFDQQSDDWIMVENIDRLISDETDGASVHVLGHDGDFWIGTAQGLARLAPRAAPPRLEWFAGDFALRDLDVTADGDLVALIEGGCSENIGAGCLSVEVVQGMDQLRVLVGEVEKIASLSGETLRHAVLQDGKIVVVDRAGIYAYDQQRRTWRTLAAGQVDAAWVSAQTGDITATMADVLVEVSRAAVTLRRDLEGGPFTQIEVASSQRVLGLARDGQLRDLQTDQVLASRDGAPPEGTLFHAGAALRDRVLLASSAGILVHDVRERFFWWKEAAALDPRTLALTDRAVNLRAAAGALWLVNEGSGTVATVTVTGDMPAITVTVSEAAVMARPLRSVTSGPTGLSVVDGQGVPVQLTKTDDVPTLLSPVGDPREGRGAFMTAAAHSEGILFATETGIWDYDQQARRWTPPFAPPSGAQIADISVGNGLYLLSRQGRLYRSGDTGWDMILGQGAGAQLSLGDVTDAKAAGATLFLGGRGLVQTYDLDVSAFGPVYGGGRGDVRLVSLENNAPVWLSGAQLRFGDDDMVDTPVLGAWAARDGIVAIAAGKGRSQFALHWPVPSARPNCMFRTAPAPQGQVIDAVELPGDRVLVATPSGVGIYVSSERRWLDVQGITPTADLRFYVASDHLVAVTDQSLLSMPLGDVPAPDSCAAPRLSLKWTVGEGGKSVAFDPARGQAILLQGDGQVLQWVNGTVYLALAAPTQGPRPEVLQQAIAAGDTLVFAATDGIWQYDLASRIWTRTSITMPKAAAPIAEVDLTVEGAGPAAVTIWTASGASYVGAWSPGGAVVDMTPATAPALAPVRTEAGDITDISADGLDWFIGSAAGIEITRAGLSEPLGNVAFPQGAGVLPIPARIARNIAFTVADFAAPQRVFVLPPNVDLATQRGALTTLGYDYSPGSDRAWGLSQDGGKLWRVDPAGVVLSCDIIAGLSAPDGCVTVLAAPLTVDPTAVGHVFTVGNDTYVNISGALVHFDPARRTRTQMAGPRLQDDAVAFQFGRDIMLWEGQGHALWRLSDTTTQAVLPGVQRMSQDAGNLVLETRDGLFRMRSGDPEGATQNASATLGFDALSYDWRRGGPFFGVDKFGNVRSGDGGFAFPLKVPGPGTIRHIAVSRPSELWVQRDTGVVTGYEIIACEHQRNPHGALGRCLAEIVGATFDTRSDEALLTVQGASQPILTFDTFEVTFSEGAFSDRRDTSLRLSVPNPIANKRGAFIAQIRTDPAGDPELAPPVAQLSSGQFEDGVGRLLAGVTQDMTAMPPMSLGWMRWDRVTSGFNVAGGGGAAVALTPAQFIRDGRMLLDHRGVARGVPGADGYEWITQNSIWRFAQAGADPALVAVVDLSAPVGLENGRLLFEDTRGLARNAQALDADTDATGIKAGALDVSTRWRARSVEARITRADGSTRAAFAATGFAHDNRAVAGWTPQGVALSSPVGLVAAANLQSVLPRPEGRDADRLLNFNGSGFAQLGGRWLVYDPVANAWSQTAKPWTRKDLADVDGVIWRLDQDKLEIVTDDPGKQWRVARNGLQFDKDQLRALAATPQMVVIATALGTHQHADVADLRSGGPADDTTVPTTPFDALSVTPNDWVLFTTGGGAVWDPDSRTWVPPDPSRAPWSSRRAVETAEIQIDISAQGAPRARRAVRQIDGSDRVALFEWGAGGHMPFDRVNGVFAEDDRVFAATDMGLRIMGDQPNRQDTLFDARPTPVSDDRPVAPATRVGRPDGDVARLLSRDQSGGCIEISAARATTACSDPGALDTLAIVSDDLWHWSKRVDALSGVYTLIQGAGRPISTSPQSRWPHDTLGVYTACAGATVEVWSDGNTIREGTTTQELAGSPRSAALCQERPVEIAPGARLDAGLYLVSDRVDPALVHSGPSRWTTVSAALSEPILERAAAAWAYEAGRLRIRGSAPSADIYQYRPMTGVWDTMPMIFGLPAMDLTRAVVSKGAAIYRITPIGMMQQTLSSGALTVDPDQVVFRTTAAPDDFAACTPDRAVRLDGRLHTIGQKGGEPVVLRCMDGRILQEDTQVSGDLGAFGPTDQDPFANRVAISEPDGWHWQMTDEYPGSVPALSMTFKDEVVSLSAGRFDLDDYRSLAAPFKSRLSLTAGLGLWEYPAANLALRSATRPRDVPDYENVTGLSSDRDQITGAPVLCLDRRDGTSIAYEADATPRQVEACLDWRGQDRLFQYRHQAEAGAQAAGLAVNGPLVARTLLEGQFVDRVAVGLPQPMDKTGGLLVPSLVGATILAANGQTQAIHSHQDVVGVAFLPQAGPAILTRSAVFPVSGQAADCPSLGSVLSQVPQEQTVHSIVFRGADLFHLRGRTPDGTFSASGRCDDDRLLRMAQEFQVDDRIRHAAVMRTQHQATRTVLVEQAADGGLILTDGRTRQVPLTGIAGTLIGIYGATQPRGAVILTDREAYLLDIDAAISALRDVDPVQAATSDAADENEATEPLQPPATVTSPRTPAPPPDPAVSQPAPLQFTLRPDPTPQQSGVPGDIAVPPTTVVDGQPVVDLGSAGWGLVADVQIRLEALGHYTGLIDGQTGPLTRAAIKAFQAQAGAPQTGYFTMQQYEQLIR